MIKAFWGSFVVFAAAIVVGGLYGGTAGIVVVVSLAALEISLSMDNAVVNSKVLKRMTKEWRRNFLFIGMPIAVFGMRLVFPLCVVAASAWISPLAALRMALHDPDRYGTVLEAAQLQVTGFGGGFLLMLFFEYFLDREKDVHWLAPVERCLHRLCHIKEISSACTLVVVGLVSLALPVGDALHLLQYALVGIAAHTITEGLGDFMGGEDEAARAVARAGVAGFIYLEVQDASFSFDGVIGALAISNNLVLIALGLGVGAMFVRSLTLLLVKNDTLGELRYLEHGAMWAVGMVAGLMFLKLRVDVPDYITGIVMAGIIGASLMHSIIHNRKESALSATPHAV